MLLRSVAFVVFVGLIGGGVFGAAQVLEDGGAVLRDVRFRAVEDEKAIRPGYGSSFAFQIENDDAEDHTFTVSVLHAAGLTVDVPGEFTVPAGEAGGDWVIVSAPEGTDAGVRTLKLQVAGAGKFFKPLLKVEVLDPAAVGDGLQDGDKANLRYYGRDAVGLFSTNMPALIESELPRTEPYSGGDRPFEARVGEGSNLVSGLRNALLGMVPGESRFVTLEPEDGYGPAILETTQNRSERLDRDLVVPLRNETHPLNAFARMLNQTGQGTPQDYEVGDEIFVPVPPSNEIPAVILKMDAQSVTYRFRLEVGHNITLYEAFPNMTQVVESSEDSVTFRTTPTYAEGEPFTYRAEWPDATEVADVTEDAIILRHTPEVGTTFMAPVRGNQEAQYTVTSVAGDEIHLEYENPNPFGGRTLYFDFTLEAPAEE